MKPKPKRVSWKQEYIKELRRTKALLEENNDLTRQLIAANKELLALRGVVWEKDKKPARPHI